MTKRNKKGQYIKGVPKTEEEKKIISEKQKGNKYGLKLKDAEIRQMAFKQYCEHIAKGLPKRAWFFEHPQYTCTARTFEKYLAENPTEFPPLHTEVASCKSYQLWFERGQKMVMGEVEKCQPAVYQMIMRNMFDWDKENSGQKESTEPLVKALAKIWRKHE
jgi:hypothetical protein